MGQVGIGMAQGQGWKQFKGNSVIQKNKSNFREIQKRTFFLESSHKRTFILMK